MDEYIKEIERIAAKCTASLQKAESLIQTPVIVNWLPISD